MKIYPVLLFPFLIAASSCNRLDTTTLSRIGVDVDVDGTRALIDNASIKTEGFTTAAYAEQKWHDNTIQAGEPGSTTNENLPGLYFTETVSYNTTDNVWSLSGDREWLNEIPLTFWSWNRNAVFASGPSYVLASGELTFSYAATDLTANTDLVLAYNSEVRSYKDDGSIDASNCSGTRTDNKINVHFYHALSEINFVVCTDDTEGSFDPSLVIKSIGFTDLVKSGDCVFTGATHDFTWSLGSTLEDYSRNFGAQTGYSSEWTSVTINSLPYRKTGGSLFVIPQTTGSTTTLILTLEDDTTREVTVSGKEWLPGKYYTYKLEAHAKSIDFTAKLIDWGDGGTYTLTK